MNTRRLSSIALLGLLAIWGCAESYFFLGGPSGGLTTPGSVVSNSSGGITTGSGAIPPPTQPAAIPGPPFPPALPHPPLEATPRAQAVALGDIDGDGLLDVASISDESQPVQIHLRNATTGLFDTITVGGAAPLSRTIRIELADMNSDGRLDIVVLVNDTGFVPPPSTS